MNSIVSSVFALVKEIFEEEKIIQLDVRNVKIQDAVIDYDFVHTIEIDPCVAACDPLFVVKVERAERVKKIKPSKLQTFKEKQNQDVCNMIDLCESILLEASKYRATKNADIRTACGVDEIFANEPQIEETDENETVPITLESCECITLTEICLADVQSPKIQKCERCILNKVHEPPVGIVFESDGVVVGYNKPNIVQDSVDSNDDDIVENDVVDSVDEPDVANIVVNNGKVELNTSHPNYITLTYEFDHLCASYLKGDDIETMRAVAFTYVEDFDEFFRLLNNEDLPELQEPEEEEPKEPNKYEVCVDSDDEIFDEIFKELNRKETSTCEKKPSEEHRDLVESTTFHSTPKTDEELLNFYREICERKANAPKKDKYVALVETIKNLNLVIGCLLNGPTIHNDEYGLTNAKARLRSKLKMVNNYLESTAEELEKKPKAMREIKNLVNWLSCEHGFFPSFVVDVEEKQEFYKLLLQFINSSYSTDYKLHYRSPRVRYFSQCGGEYLRDILAPTKKSYFKDECIAFYHAYNDIFKSREAFIRYDAENKKFINTRD